MTITKITAKTHDVGGIPIARLLPNRAHRTIGAWCFLDHAGPAHFTEQENGMQVGAHPHTNLQTFTWMLEGEVLHQDSLGNRQTIRPKQVNLMTAGTGDHHGISHTEQTPAGIKTLHAVQLWIALPMSKTIAPDFRHYPEMPEWSDNGANFVLVNGSFAGRTAPTEQHSPLLGLDIRTRQAQTLGIPAQAGWESPPKQAGNTACWCSKAKWKSTGKRSRKTSWQNSNVPTPPKPCASAPKQAATLCCWAANPCHTRR